jgi:hypothetical protein
MARTAACKVIKIHGTFVSNVNDTGEQWWQLKKCLSHCATVAPIRSSDSECHNRKSPVIFRHGFLLRTQEL